MLRQLKNPFVIVLFILFIIATIFAVYFHTQLTELRQDPQKIAQQKAEDLVRRVGELILLPYEEYPTIATVYDPKLLEDQPFFKEAKQGYRVLIYTSAQKAILYDPINHVIVAEAPLSINGEFLTPPSQE